MKRLVVFLLAIQLLDCARIKKNNGNGGSSGSGGRVNRHGVNVDKVLDRFQQVTAENCQGGAADNVENVALNYALWEEFTPIATSTANLMSGILTRNKCSVASLPDSFYYDVITSNIIGTPGVFASSITLRPGLYPKKRLFAPYAFKKDGGILQIDISDSYDYTTKGTPYWDIPSTKNYDDVSTTKITRQVGKKGNKEVTKEVPVATRKDGLWTPPYFDCGGGNVWLTTHTSPILCRDCKTKKNTFEGVGYFDIDLSNKDINQCSSNDDKSETTKDAFNDLFRGTDRCQDTTQCRPKSGVGLKRGGYECVCKKGYYFPSNGYKKAFDGLIIEHVFNRKGDMSQFKCLPCKAGCEECTDGNSCLKEKSYYDNKSNKWAFEEWSRGGKEYNSEFAGYDL